MVQPSRARQVYDGLGAGAIFYEGHITSLAARNKNERQQQLYDDMFARVPTHYLQLMIRETHEPQNDNADPYTPAFDEKNFEYCKHTIADRQGGAEAAAGHPALRHAVHAAAVDENQQRRFRRRRSARRRSRRASELEFAE